MRQATDLQRSGGCCETAKAERERSPERRLDRNSAWPHRRHSVEDVHIHAMAVDFPVVHGHPNRLPFEGVLTLVDVASDKAPSGARGHRVILTRQAAEAALPSLLGMAVGYKAGWDGHDARQKCGIITAAELEGNRMVVSGFLFARDFPEVGPELEKFLAQDGAMGMSYELADAHVTDMRAPVWTISRATFTGAAILLREKAAYRSTSFRVKRTGRQTTSTPLPERAAKRCRTQARG